MPRNRLPAFLIVLMSLLAAWPVLAGERTIIVLDGSGTAVDVDDSGALVVEGEDGTRSTVTVGDVVHLRV